MTPGHNRRPDRRPTAIVLALSALLGVVSAQNTHDTTKHGDPAFHEREREVMPFDVNKTLHVFERTKGGGVQRVVVRDRGDTRNLASIRTHLREEAAAFGRGAFDDPAYLHGEAMPGLATLKAAGKQGKLRVTYTNLPTGAKLTYTTKDPRVVSALHAWFEAQVRDHGSASRLR